MANPIPKAVVKKEETAPKEVVETKVAEQVEEKVTSPAEQAVEEKKDEGQADIKETTEEQKEPAVPPVAEVPTAPPAPQINDGLPGDHYYERSDETFFTYAANAGLKALNDYIVNMQPNRPQTPESGSRHQRSLFRGLELILEKCDDVEFNKVWKKVLDTVAPEIKSGCFNDRYAHRFPESIPMTIEERNSFHGLVNLMTGTAVVANRKAFFNVFDIRRGCGGSLSDRALTRLVDFYEA